MTQENLAQEQSIETTGSEVQETKVGFDDYLKAVPADLKTIYEKNNIKDFEGQSKWISNLNSLIGKKSEGIIAPAADAPEEKHKEYHEKLAKAIGRPDKAEDYKLSLPENFKEENVDKEMVAKLNKVAHENAVPAKAMEQLYKAFYEDLGNKLQENSPEKTTELLQKEWGKDYDTKFAKINSLFKVAESHPEYEKMKQISGNPYLAKFLDVLAQKISPDSLQISSNGGNVSTGELAEKLQKLWKEANDVKLPAVQRVEKRKLFDEQYKQAREMGFKGFTAN